MEEKINDKKIHEGDREAAIQTALERSVERAKIDFFKDLAKLGRALPHN